MKEKSKRGRVLVKDNDGGYYLIEHTERDRFEEWLNYMECSNDFACEYFKGEKEFFENRVDFPRLLIYEWEEA